MEYFQTNCLSAEKSIVSVVACHNYDQYWVSQAVEHSIQNIGGLKHLINSNTRVHIKPNLLSAKEPQQAVTTHPAIVKAVVEMVHKLGAKVSIGDSPAGISRPIEEYWYKTGMKIVAEETAAQLIALEKKGVVERRINGKSYFISRPITEADVIINLCKMKTHSLTLFTGAIKNMFGVIPGVKKGEFHKIAPKAKDFSRIVVDIFETIKPQINIMDAVVAMEGNGPSNGKPKRVGLILASTDAVALDSLASYLMGFNDGEIITTRLAHERGLGQRDLNQIEIRGIDRDQIKLQNFQLPSNRFHQLIPESIMKAVSNLIWIRPRAIPEACKKCGLCIQNCPVKAMTADDDGVPLIDYKVCIKCFCCDEICPHNAIEQQTSWLAKKLS